MGSVDKRLHAPMIAAPQFHVAFNVCQIVFLQHLHRRKSISGKQININFSI